MNTTTVVTAIVTMATSVITALFVFYWQRQQTLRDKDAGRRAEARRQESLLSMEMSFAASKLAHATAMAVKYGKVNGEMDEAEQTYTETKRNYTRFLNEQAQRALYK